MKIREYLKVINFYRANEFWFTQGKYYIIFYPERRNYSANNIFRSAFLQIMARVRQTRESAAEMHEMHRRAKRADQFIDASNQPSNKSDKLTLR